MTAPKALTRKAGPLPVYAWVALALVSFLLYRHFHSTTSAAATGQTPVTPDVGSAAQQPAGGGGTAADNSSGDLLSALGANSAAADALLSAVQSASAGGGLGVSSGTGTAGGSSSGAAGAASADAPVDTTTSPTPTDPTVMGTGPFGVPGVGAGSPNEFNIGVAAPSDYNIFGNPYGSTTTLAQGTPTGPDPYGTQALADMWAANLAAGSPSPTVVQPAPVDTTSPTVALTPMPTLGHPVMV